MTGARFRGVNGRSIREVLNTIGRYGVIDRQDCRGQRLAHGLCLPARAVVLADGDRPRRSGLPGQSVPPTFDYERDHAIEASGRVKSRWCYGAGDAMPGHLRHQRLL